MVDGPPSPRSAASAAQEKVFKDWSSRTTKRPLENSGGENQDKKAASSSSPAGPPISPTGVSGDQRISDASYYVEHMNQEKEKLGLLLAEQTRVAQMAALESVY